MSAYRWQEQTRESLNELLIEGVVVLPVGATEQHGPHLATGTDALLAETVAARAADRAHGSGCSRPLIVAPSLSFGASDHHLPFGGTLSLRAETLLEVLLDVARSIHAGGGRRLLIVNGHGGNRGVCSAAVAAASTRFEGLAAAYLDYWALAESDDTPIPGHAGAFETSLVLAVESGLVRDRADRASVPVAPTVDRVEIAAQEHWEQIDGFTDEPATATEDGGKRRLDELVEAMAKRFGELATAL